MCKVIIIPDASKVPNFPLFSRWAASWLSDQRDGFGFAAVGERGVFGVRSLSPEGYASEDERPLPDYVTGPHVPFGQSGDVSGAAIFHGRISTNSVSIVNTHPIQRDGHYLIHNGVVTHHGQKYAKHTSNDSEDVLFNFMSGGIEAVASNLTGYYAAAIIRPDGTLAVFRDSIARLYYAYSEVLQSPVFATTRDLLEDVAEYLDEEFTTIGEVRDDIYLLFRGAELVEQRAFKSRGWDKHAASLSHLSLGRTLTSDASFEYSDDADYNRHDVSEKYLLEQEYFDLSYTFQYGHREISLEEYQAMPLSEQIEIVVRRHDGTEVSPFAVVGDDDDGYSFG